MLAKKKYDKISVGSVEEFQGQERTVIIVSTVRSKPEYMSFDMQFHLGFLRNPKVRNVNILYPQSVVNPSTRFLSSELSKHNLMERLSLDNAMFINVV